MVSSAKSTQDSAPRVWTKVSDDAGTNLPTRVLFEAYGEEFIGIYQGPKTITPGGNGDPFKLYLFKRDEGSEELFSIGDTFTVRSAMKKVRVGSWVRFTYVDDVTVASGEIKNITVEVAS